VTLDQQRTVTGQVVGYDALTDLALVKVPVQGLTAAQWADSDQLQAGELVWAIGNPFGLQRSITFGILSARQGNGVAPSPYYDFLQTDAVVNPGNSGGPLVNRRGEVIGVTTTILGATYQGVSFAIPANTARAVADQLQKSGKVARGWLGITTGPVDAERASQLGMPRAQGVYVVALINRPDGTSPATAAGILPGDVILQWNGQTVEDMASFARRVASTTAGTNVQLTLLRGGQPLTLTAQVAVHP
jgi:serine protease Do